MSGKSRILEPADLEGKDTHVNVTHGSAVSAAGAASAGGAGERGGRVECGGRMESSGIIWEGRRDGRVAEGGGLLNRCTVKSCTGGSNPPLSAIACSRRSRDARTGFAVNPKRE